MAAHDHFIEKCSNCETVMGQCRCPSKTKEVLWVLCERCRKQNVGVQRALNAIESAIYD